MCSGIFFACSKDKMVEIDSATTLQLIKADIESNKSYNQDFNQYGYSSDKFAQAVYDMPVIFNNKTSKAKNSALKTNMNMTPEEYKAHVLQIYGPLGHNATEIDELFKTAQSMIDKSSSYSKLLDNLSKSGVIPEEESKILKDYLALFYSENDMESFRRKTTVYIHYVNESNFTALEKRGMLTVFDILSDNQKIFLEGTYVFSNAFSKSRGTASFKSSNKTASLADMDTVCGGRIIIGLVGGAITGNGIGGLVGVGAALFENWAAGCWN